MGQSESMHSDEQLLSSPKNSNGFNKGKKVSQKVSLSNELDNLSAGSGDDDIVNALEDALGFTFFFYSINSFTSKASSYHARSFHLCFSFGQLFS